MTVDTRPLAKTRIGVAATSLVADRPPSCSSIHTRGMDEVAIAASISGAVVGVAGIAFAAWNGREERSHGRALAREARFNERRADVYLRSLRFLHKEMRELEGANPMSHSEMHPAAREHDRLAEAGTPEEQRERWRRNRDVRLEVVAEVTAFGSPEVLALVTEFLDAQEAFGEAWRFSGDPTPLDEAVGRAMRALRGLDEQVRIELRE